MRAAVLCVVIAFAVQRGSWAENDFRPTPIPLNDWHYERREGKHLHEDTQTEAPFTLVAVHYWEDALRHSVYLTLVRDKIDQLIAKGEVVSPDNKPDQFVSKEVDDHDLWEKIKSAPFDRLQDVEPDSFGDVSIMAKGRLIEEKGGLRFVEDELKKEKCSNEKCMEGIKAYWSVKRIRQRDADTSPGRYHYELTFSVITQAPPKQRKPYENPIRTFTVKETTPERVVDMPQEYRGYERVQISTHRPERALWFHKNLAPTQPRQHQNGLDRLFFSLFSDDDDDYDSRQRYRPPTYGPPGNTPIAHGSPPYSQNAKVGYVSSPSDQQKRLTPYPYKPHSYKYARPPLAPPPHSQHHFLDMDQYVPSNNQFAPQQDYRYGPPNKNVKTTRPAVLPTPILPPKNWTFEDEKNKANATDSTTKATEIITSHKSPNKPRPPPMKINYLPDHVRPPIYNAPPGVFVTMDKKPFKPMPPLKYIHTTKPYKSHKPIDFRPSPQVLDMKQFSEPDPLFETAFRPITWKYSETNTTEKIEVAESSTQVNNTRKPVTKGKKPPKKHENIKSERLTTPKPEIITVSSQSAEETDSVEWANIVGAFIKTTPMVSQKEKVPESTTSLPTTTTVSTTTKRKRTTTTTEAPEETTTEKPKKRTRPPPKFIKTSEKIKKHKRTTSTTTKAPEVKTTQDLTPQASSAAATKPTWNTTLITTSTTTSMTTTAKPTTTTKTTTTKTTTTQAPSTSTSTSTTAESKSDIMTTQPKIKNRFRQSTLLTKGTSINHDKWSVPSLASGDTTRPAALAAKPPRRNGSNFQGYVLSSTQRYVDKNEKHYYTTTTTSTTEEYKPASTSATYEETVDQYENGNESDYSNNPEDHYDDNQENDEQETRDHNEYIFQSSSTEPNDKTNEIIAHEEPITEPMIASSEYSAPKNKTKCKKKKQNITTTEEPTESYDITTTTSTPTEIPARPSIFEELFGSFNVDDNKETKQSTSTSKPELDKQQSENHSKFVKLDDDLQDFLDSLNKGEDHSDEEAEYDEDDEQEPSIDDDESPYNNDDDDVSPRESIDNYDYHDRPYSLLELMSME